MQNFMQLPDKTGIGQSQSHLGTESACLSGIQLTLERQICSWVLEATQQRRGQTNVKIMRC